MKTLKHLVILTLVTFSALAFVASGIAQIDSSRWPKEMRAEKYTIIIYQPQNESYADGKLKSRAAFSIKADDAESPTFGALWATSSMNIDRVNRMMSLASTKIDAVRFPVDVEESKVERFKKFLEEEVPRWDIEISQDELIASLEEVEVSSSDSLKTDPPLIIFSKKPAMMVLIDGEPSLRDLDDRYQGVVNTAVFMVKEKRSKYYYLSGGDYWYRAKNAKGPWKYRKKVSNDLKKLKEKMRPGDGESEKKSKTIPAIVVSTEPAELIVIDGKEKFVPIQYTNLLYVDNTESDLFMNIETQEYFILLSGRWFTSTNSRGPWSYLAADQLPEDFARIPEGSPKDAILANVPGTKAAQEARYDAQMPQTAAVDRRTAAANAKVEYNGEATFQKIDGTSLQYAVNTSSTVVKSGTNTIYVITLYGLFPSPQMGHGRFRTPDRMR